MEPNPKEANWLLKEKYHGIIGPNYQADLKRLMQGEPLAYIIGRIPFLDCTISLDSRPLIPRTETEYWVSEVIKNYTETKTHPKMVLDLCAGSGCIGIALGRAFPAAKIDFAEIDTSHHSTIRNNYALNQLKNPVRIFDGHLFSNLPTREHYDLILSNPPYIDTDLKRVSPSVSNYEPALALYGGQAGLEIINEIIVESHKHLTPGGAIWLEHEPEHAEIIVELGFKHNFLVTTQEDQYGILRFSRLLLQ
jgi:release factor glutamine methyltransferase